MVAVASATPKREARARVYQAIASHMQADVLRAIWQLANTFIPYFGLWALMAITVQKGLPYWLTLILAIPAAGLHVRVFIFFHDCVHGSFFESQRANRILGYLCGILTFTPFEQWRRAHAIHHATVGDLDRRGTGDVWTLTVDEYQALPWWKRFVYRGYRNPLLMFFVGPSIIFLIAHRLPHKGAKRMERFSVIFTDLALLAVIGIASLTIGFRTYFMVQYPILLISGCLGVWMFYVQHQFEGGYWARHEEWDPLTASLAGSSYYKLPKVLQWFTGSIGLHHVHHVQPRIPNYNLQKCNDAVPELNVVEPLTIKSSLRSLNMNLWDETHNRFVSFRSLKTRPRLAEEL
jgi:omega-6 fatty acid desaturase (delta-12 desaturase)